MGYSYMQFSTVLLGNFVKKLSFDLDLYLKSNCFLEELKSQWAFTCSKLKIETLEQSVQYVQS